jgi:hypothetical protein
VKLKNTEFFRAGSFGNGTSVRNFSDVDYFAIIPTKHLTQNSTSSLTKVWRVLMEDDLDLPKRLPTAKRSH